MVCLEGELVLDSTGIIDHTHPGGVGAHIQSLDHPGHEDFDFLKLLWAHASRAVDDKHQVGGLGSTQGAWKQKGGRQKIKEKEEKNIQGGKKKKKNLTAEDLQAAIFSFSFLERPTETSLTSCF